MLKFHFPFYRFNDKSKQQDKKVLSQGLELPSPSLTTSKAPAALSKPSVLPTRDTQPYTFHNPPSSVGLAKVKDRKNKPSYLKILPSPNPAVSFQLVTGPGNTAVLVPSSVPPASVPSTSQGGMKQKSCLRLHFFYYYFLVQLIGYFNCSRMELLTYQVLVGKLCSFSTITLCI